ncbi:MAG: response regulator transcription factor [Chloroflexota bacterium]|nr:response regulator transcription factor [Chloroflexota bacterium]
MTLSQKILLIGEDYDGLMQVNFHLQQAGHRVLLAWNNHQALEYLRREEPALAILDQTTSETGSLEVCRTLRQIDARLCIMILSNQNNEELKVKSFEVGIDDYILKPFSPRELALRVNALLRRVVRWSSSLIAEKQPTVTEKQPVLSTSYSSRDNLPEKPSYSQFNIDVYRRQVYKNGLQLELTRLEFDLLKFLYDNRGYVLSRDRLLEGVWKYNHSGDARVVDVVMARLRRKIEDDPNSPNYIQTIRGVGYKYVA